MLIALSPFLRAAFLMPLAAMPEEHYLEKLEAAVALCQQKRY